LHRLVVPVHYLDVRHVSGGSHGGKVLGTRARTPNSEPLVEPRRFTTAQSTPPPRDVFRDATGTNGLRDDRRREGSMRLEFMTPRQRRRAGHHRRRGLSANEPIMHAANRRGGLLAFLPGVGRDNRVLQPPDAIPTFTVLPRTAARSTIRFERPWELDVPAAPNADVRNSRRVPVSHGGAAGHAQQTCRWLSACPSAPGSTASWRAPYYRPSSSSLSQRLRASASTCYGEYHPVWTDASYFVAPSGFLSVGAGRRIGLLVKQGPELLRRDPKGIVRWRFNTCSRLSEYTCVAVRKAFGVSSGAVGSRQLRRRTKYRARRVPVKLPASDPRTRFRRPSPRRKPRRAIRLYVLLSRTVGIGGWTPPEHSRCSVHTAGRGSVLRPIVRTRTSGAAEITNGAWGVGKLVRNGRSGALGFRSSAGRLMSPVRAAQQEQVRDSNLSGKTASLWGARKGSVWGARSQHARRERVVASTGRLDRAPGIARRPWRQTRQAGQLLPLHPYTLPLCGRRLGSHFRRCLSRYLLVTISGRAPFAASPLISGRKHSKVQLTKAVKIHIELLTHVIGHSITVVYLRLRTTDTVRRTSAIPALTT